MKVLTKRLLALGASSVIAVTGGYLVGPWEGEKKNAQGENIAYKDIVGIPTICAGYTIGVKLGDKKTDQECDELLVKELTDFNTKMMKSVKVPLPENMEVAYTSLVWNIGIGAWNSSTILQKINANDLQGACKGILAWNKATFSPSAVASQRAKGETCSIKKNGDYACTVKGLTNRRIDEYKVCAGENADVNEALRELSQSVEEPLTVDGNGLETLETPPPIATPSLPEINAPEPLKPIEPIERTCTKKFLLWCIKWNDHSR